MKPAIVFLSSFVVVLTLGLPISRAGDPIPVAKVQHDGEVSFQNEVLPILRKKCLACHNSSDAESDLILETPAAMLKGGSLGPAIVSGKGLESLLLKVAAHQEEPVMPPEDNDVDAKNLTSDELGLIQLWIDQGAGGTVAASAEMQWQPLPPGVNPVYATAISPDGRYVAAARANQVALYSLPANEKVAQLDDPALLESGIYPQPGVAHLDLVQSMAFHPNGHMLATGGYRTVKIWQRALPEARASLPAAAAELTGMAIDQAGKLLATADQEGNITVAELPAGKVLRQWKVTGDGDAGVTDMALSAKSDRLLTAAGQEVTVWNLADGKSQGSWKSPASVVAVSWCRDDQHFAIATDDQQITVWPLELLQAPEPAKAAAANAEEPAKDEPAKDEPAKDEPAKDEPAKDEPAKDEPAKDEPAKDEPAKDEQAEPATETAEQDEPAKPVHTLVGHQVTITALAVVPSNANWMVSASRDGTVRLWDVNTGKPLRQMKHGAPVLAVAVGADGQRAVSVAENATGRIWDLANGQQKAEFQGDYRHADHISASARDMQLAGVRVNNAKQDLDEAKKRHKSETDNTKKSEEELKKAGEALTKKQEEAKKPEQQKADSDKAVAAAKQKIEDSKAAQQAADKGVPRAVQAVKAADTAQKDALAQLQVTQQTETSRKQAAAAAKTAAAGDPENKELADKLAAADQEASAASSAREAAQQKADQAKQVKLAADQAKTKADADKKQAAAAVKTAEADLKKVEADAKKKADAAAKAVNARDSASRAVEAAERTLARSKKLVAQADELVKSVEQSVNELQERQQQSQAGLESQKKELAQQKPRLVTVAIAPAGWIVTGAADGRLLTWNGETGQPLECTVTSSSSAGLCVDAAGQIWSTQGNVAHAWSAVPPWRLVSTIGGERQADLLIDRVTALAFSPDGSLLATGSGEPSRSGQIKLWNVSDGSLMKEIPEAHSDTVLSLQFSREGGWLVSSAADRFVKLFNLEDGKLVRSFEGHTGHVLGVALSADERLMASSGADQVVKIWDARTGDQKRTIQGFRKEVTGVRFVGDSRNVLTLCGDRTVSVKRSDNGGNVRSFGGSSDYVYAGDVSADGKRIVAAGHDSVVRVWTDDGKVLATFEEKK